MIEKIKLIYRKIDKFNPFTIRIRKLQDRIYKLECENEEARYKLQRGRVLETKMCEYNSYLNKILYEESLKSKTKIKDFNPLVSIIIPAYNASNFLETAINCALNQTYKNIEIIIVNDGSKDNGKTEKIAKKYKNKVRYYSKKNGGVSSALNYGIKKMKGDYFAWLSHDDMMTEKHIEHLVEFASYEEHKGSIPYSSIKCINEFGDLYLQESIESQLYFSDYKMSLLQPEYCLLKGEINGGAILIPKEAFDKVGLFAEDQRITQERDMWDRLLKHYKLINIPYETSYVRIHSNQVSQTNPNIQIETNAKNLKILKNLTEEQKRRLEENDNQLYDIMAEHHFKNNNKELSKEIKKLKNNKDISKKISKMKKEKKKNK